MEVKLSCECLCCFESEDRQTQRAKRVTDTEKETVQGSCHARTHAREKEIGSGELPVLPVADPVPRMRTAHAYTRASSNHRSQPEPSAAARQKAAEVS